MVKQAEFGMFAVCRFCGQRTELLPSYEKPHKLSDPLSFMLIYAWHGESPGSIFECEGVGQHPFFPPHRETASPTTAK